MSVQTLGVSAARGEDVIVELAAHLPPTVPLGRPVLVWRDPDDGAEIAVCEDGDQMVMWQLDAGVATRTVELTRGWHEDTRFCRGREVRRRLVRLVGDDAA